MFRRLEPTSRKRIESRERAIPAAAFELYLIITLQKCALDHADLRRMLMLAALSPHGYQRRIRCPRKDAPARCAMGASAASLTNRCLGSFRAQQRKWL